MELLERRILEEGSVLPGGVLKVDSFLNHQMDPLLFLEMGKEFYRLYQSENINKILTIETSGIGIACVAGLIFKCPVLFARKHQSRNMSGEFYTTEVKSFTHGNVSTIYVSKKYLDPSDRILIIDDFLANGAALCGLISLAEQAGAAVVGAGIAVEKSFQPGREMITKKGYRVESLARIKRMEDNGFIEFC